MVHVAEAEAGVASRPVASTAPSVVTSPPNVAFSLTPRPPAVRSAPVVLDVESVVDVVESFDVAQRVYSAIPIEALIERLQPTVERTDSFSAMINFGSGQVDLLFLLRTKPGVDVVGIRQIGVIWHMDEGSVLHD